MKSTLLTIATFGALTASGLAASLTLTGGAGANGTGFADSAGSVFQSPSSPGVVGFGIFSVTDSEIMNATSPSTLISAFQGFGASSTGAFTAAGFTGAQGTFSRNSVGTIGGSEFADQNIYVFVGNGSSYGDSTEFAVLKTNFTFNASDDSVPTPVVNTFAAGDVTPLVGTLVADVRTTSSDSTETPGFHTATLVAIPEPSVAILGAFGLLGLVRRRR